MPEQDDKVAATVPEQPEAKPPLRKSMPVVIALVVILGLIGIANLPSLLSGNKKNAPANTMPMRPAAPNAQQVNSFESQQQLQAQRDAEARQRQQELNAAMQELQQAEGGPGPEAAGAPPMTAAQRAAIYDDNLNAPQRTSNMSEAQAEAKQKHLAEEKQHEDAVNSDTMAVDFGRAGLSPATVAVEATQEAVVANSSASVAPTKLVGVEAKPNRKSDPMAGYDFDTYDGRLYRVFEGTVLEGVVSNHIDERPARTRSRTIGSSPVRV
ncbi:MAG TPA: hypothetical protein VJU82_14250 [Acidobacteriaceae bacterium]|nr:hypothetical protein [Acidobacteriaceae bacterium]